MANIKNGADANLLHFLRFIPYFSQPGRAPVISKVSSSAL